MATSLCHPIAWTTYQAPRTHTTPTPEGATMPCLWVVSINALPRARIYGYQNINWLSIDYACRPRLRSRLTLGRRTCHRNTLTSGLINYHYQIRYSLIHDY